MENARVCFICRMCFKASIANFIVLLNSGKPCKSHTKAPQELVHASCTQSTVSSPELQKALQNPYKSYAKLGCASCTPYSHHRPPSHYSLTTLFHSCFLLFAGAHPPTSVSNYRCSMCPIFCYQACPKFGSVLACTSSDGFCGASI